MGGEIVCKLQSRRIGYFLTLEEAEIAVKKARLELHQEFANHG